MSRSYFDKQAIEAKTNRLRKTAECPEWLTEALEELAANAELFPAEEDDQRYTVEYIYPH